VVEARGASLELELVGKPVPPPRIEVAGREHPELVRIGQVALEDVRAADAAAHHRHRIDSAHDAHSVPRSASSWAPRASAMALKQRSCGIAVSVRFSTSAMSWRP